MQKQTFTLSIPSYSKLDDQVLYEFLVEDHFHQKKWTAGFKYKELQQFYETLIDYKLKKHLIEFPEKPFWKFWVDPEATPELIEERRESLEEFFKHILHNKHTKNHKLIVNFMKIAHQRRDMGPERAHQSPISSTPYSPPYASARSMSPKTGGMSSPLRTPLVKSKSLYGFTFSKGMKKKQSFAAMSASSLIGNSIGRRLSLKPVKI